MKVKILCEAGLQTLVITPDKDEYAGDLLDFFHNPNPCNIEFKTNIGHNYGEIWFEKRWP